MRPAQHWFDFRQLRDRIGPDNDVYMDRRQLFAISLGPWTFQLRQHKIMREDRDPNPHTHPFAFFSLLTRGGYFEQLYTPEGRLFSFRYRSRWSFAFRGRNTLHNIVELEHNQPVTTLVLAILDKRKGYDWGFVNVNTGEYTNSREYLQHSARRARSLRDADFEGLDSDVHDIKD